MINIAIIGTGAISPSHIKGYLGFPDSCKIVAPCDIYEEKAEKQAKEFGLDAKIYNDYKEMLEQNEIHLVSVCTPPYTLADIAIQALNQGKRVLVEKPMTSSLEECDAMNEVEKKSGKILSVIAQNRFTTPMMKLKHVL